MFRTAQKRIILEFPLIHRFKCQKQRHNLSDGGRRHGSIGIHFISVSYTHLSSANDAAVVLAEAVAGSEDAFVGMMNEKAKDCLLYTSRCV